MALRFVEDRVIISVKMDWKNFHTFSNGTEIRLERKYNNFNLREVNPQNAFVISAKNIPSGAEILIDYNATHETYRLVNYKPLSGEDISSDVKYFSVPVSECYLWRELEIKHFSSNGHKYGGGKWGDWQPVYPYTIAERVFEPSQSIIIGIEPKQIKDTLYIKSGKLKGKVVRTLVACDYQIVFRDLNGQENGIIVCRYYEKDEDVACQEIIAIDEGLTEKLENGELLIGLTPTSAKNLKQLHHA